jgi:hypothetical protein
MKKFFSKTVYALAAALAVGAFASCSNDENVPSNVKDGDKTVALSLNLVQPASTRLVDAGVGNGQALDIESLEVLFYGSTGTIYEKYAIPGKINGVDVTIADLKTEGKVQFHGVNNSVDHVAVIGNTTTSLAAGDNIQTTPDLAANLLAAESQASEATVALYGWNNLTETANSDENATAPNQNDGYKIWKAKVDIAPIAARVELGGVTVGKNLASFHIKGVYLDEFYKKAGVRGDAFDSNNLKAPTETVAGMATDYTAVATWKDIMFNEDGATPAWLATQAAAATPGTGKVWGYYAFAKQFRSDLITGTKTGEITIKTATNDDFTYATTTRAALGLQGSQVPSIIVAIDQVAVDKTAAGMNNEVIYNSYYYGEALTDAELAAKYPTKLPDSKVWYVTISGFKTSEATPKDFTGIFAGYVFSVDASKFVIDNDDLSETPHAKLIDVQVQVNPISWKKVDVLPAY